MSPALKANALPLGHQSGLMCGAEWVKKQYEVDSDDGKGYVGTDKSSVLKGTLCQHWSSYTWPIV